MPGVCLDEFSGMLVGWVRVRMEDRRERIWWECIASFRSIRKRV